MTITSDSFNIFLDFGGSAEMQASERFIQRRSPAADPGPPPSVPARSISPPPVNIPQPRASNASGKSSQNGSMNKRQMVSSVNSAFCASRERFTLSIKHQQELTFYYLERPVFSGEPECTSSFADRKERHPSPRSDEATSRNPHTMVSTPSDGCASFRRICQTRI